MPVTPKGFEIATTLAIDTRTVAPSAYTGQIVKDSINGGLYRSDGVSFIPINPTNPTGLEGEETIVDHLDDLTSWTTSGVVAEDPVDYIHRGKSFKLTSINQATVQITKAISLNMSDHFFRFWAKCDVYANLFGLNLELEIGNSGWTKEFIIDTGNILSYYWGHNFSGRDGEWVLISIPRSGVIPIGGAAYSDWANITKVRFSLWSHLTKTVNINLDVLSKVRLPAKGMVTFTFDDGYTNLYTDGKRVLDKYGYRGVVGIITGLVGGVWDGDNLMSWAQIKQVEKCGWDMASHSHSHASYLNTLDNDRLSRELGLSQELLIQHGILRGSRFLLYPYGGYNQTVISKAMQYYLGCRRVGRTFTAFPPTELYQMGCISIENTTTVAQVQAYIDTAKQYKEWIIFLFHKIMTPANAATKYTPADLELICDYINAQGVPVVTFSEVLDQLYPKILDNQPRRFAASENKMDLFMDCVATATDWIRNNEDLSAGIPIAFTIDNQPDVPRTLTWVLTHANITEFDLVIVGVNAKGETVTETFTEASGWSGETSHAYATITSITLTTRTGTGVGDTMDIGIGNKLGVSNPIESSTGVYKIKKNAANYPSASYVVSATYDTVNVVAGGAIAGGDDFTIMYRARINDLS